MPGEITEIDELQFIMEKVHWIDSSLEVLCQWEDDPEPGEMNGINY